MQIIDTGRGIPTEVLETIFTPFEQGDPSIALQFGGLGLGLSIAKAFVEKHGGTIAAHSEGAGNGVTMTITFPLLNPTLAALPEAAAGPKPDEVTKAAKFNILLVDDHRDTLSVLSRLLAARGHTVTTATSCAEATKALNDKTQLIVSDVGLPDGTGYELIAKVRESTQVPAIAMSGFGMESDIEESRAAGFQAHLTKPVDLPRLLQLIQELGAA